MGFNNAFQLLFHQSVILKAQELADSKESIDNLVEAALRLRKTMGMPDDPDTPTVADIIGDIIGLTSSLNDNEPMSEAIRAALYKKWRAVIPFLSHLDVCLDDDPMLWKVAEDVSLDEWNSWLLCLKHYNEISIDWAKENIHPDKSFEN